MRLGQLARRLELRPAQIVEFLAVKGIQIDESVNARVDDDQVKVILNYFDPDSAKVASVETGEMDEPEVLELKGRDEVVETEFKREDITISQTPQEETIHEVIKAPKVALSGLKVLGKIDLPEPKKKEEPLELMSEVPPVEASAPSQQRPVRNADRKGQRHHQRERKNPIALQREREAIEAQKKREEEAEREKERRTRNYHKRVKMSPPTKAMRLVDEPVMQMSEKELEEAPKTWLGKLIKWFTTA